MQEPFWERCLP